MKDLYQDIFIYVNKQGKLFEVPAYISKMKPMKLAFAISAFDRDNNHILMQIAREPGMIFNHTVWYKKKDFKKAKCVFMNYYGEKINRLNDELEATKNEMGWLTKQEEL